MIIFIFTFIIVVLLIFLFWKFFPATFNAILYLLNTLFKEIKQKMTIHKYKVKDYDNKENDDL
jgi:hypothetical protein